MLDQIYRKTAKALFIALACFLFMASGPAFAKLTIMPTLEVEGQYTDNYRRSEENKQKVYAVQVAPGIQLEALSAKGYLNVDYKLRAYWYQDDNNVQGVPDAKDDNYIGHDFNLIASYRVGEKTTVGITDQFFLTREPASADQFSDATARDKYWRNRVEPFAQYDMAEWGSAKIAYRNEVLRYIDDVDPGKENSVENRGILTLTYNFNQKQHLDLEMQGWKRTYDGEVNSDYQSIQPKVFYRHDFTEELSGKAGFGYHWRDYDQSQLDDWDDWVMSAELQGTFAKTKLFATLARNINDFATNDDYQTAWRFDLAGERRFYQHFITRLSGYYQYGDFQQQDREDTTIGARVGAGYAFWKDMLELMLSYSYTNRDSNVSGYDYTENQVFLSLNLLYDFNK